MLSKNELRELEESRMTPKKLLAIAEELAECATDNPMWRKFGYVAGYVLANVRDDDNDPVTPERLVELGGELDEHYEAVAFPNCVFWFSRGVLKYVKSYHAFDQTLKLMGHFGPRNMKEARELLVRCGAIKEETSNEN